MLKKVTTDVKAAIVLIATENVTALRMFFRNLTKSIKSAPKRRNAKGQDKKEFVNRKEA